MLIILAFLVWFNSIFPALCCALALHEVHPTYTRGFALAILSFIPVLNTLLCLWVLWRIITQQGFGEYSEFLT